MKWTKTPKDQTEVGINQELRLECDAQGSPEPRIEWAKHLDKAEAVDGNGESIVLQLKPIRHTKPTNFSFSDSNRY